MMAGRWVVGARLDWEMLPPRVEAVIAERIGRLPERWQALLATASVEGEAFSAEILARALGADEPEIMQCLSGPLEHEHRLVFAQGIERFGEQRLSRYRFRHDLFQTVPVRPAGCRRAGAPARDGRARARSEVRPGRR